MDEPQKNDRLRSAVGPLGMVTALVLVIIAGLVIGSRFLERPVSYGASLSKTASPNQDASSSTSGEVLTITMAEVKEKLSQGAEVTILDVSTAATYDRFHLQGAISIPYAELSKRVSELSRQSETIVYACTT